MSDENMYKHIKSTTVKGLVSCFVTLPLMSQAADLVDVNEIIKQANHAAYYQADSGRALVDMTITDKAGRKSKRRFVILRKDNADSKIDGDQKFYIYFKKPADVKKTTFLVWKKAGREDDRWLYLPALDLVKRIAASDDRTSFVGSNFYYEDVSGRGLKADVHTLTQTTDQYYVVKSVPKKPAAVEFAYYISHVDKETMLPMKTQYFSANKRNIRSFEAQKVQKIDGYYMVTQSVMKDLVTQGSTKMSYRKIQFNNVLPDQVFTERSLRKSPSKYLK